MSDLDARHYQKYSALQYNRVKTLIDPGQFNGAERVLDIGSGDGRISAEIASWIPSGKVIAIDASRNMIDLAKESFPSSSHPNLEFRLASADELGEFELFDRIVSFHCLNWVRRPKAALEHMCRLLKPQGELLILTYLKASSYAFLEAALKEYPQYEKEAAIHTMLSAEEHLQILHENRMEIEEFLIQKKFSHYENKEEWRNYLKGWVGNFVQLPEEIRDGFLDRAVEHSCAFQVPTGPVSFSLSGLSLVIRAKKSAFLEQ